MITDRRTFVISHLGKSVIDQKSAFTKDMAQRFLRQHLDRTPIQTVATFYLDRIQFNPEGLRSELFYRDINQFFKCEEKPGVFMIYVINAEMDRHTFESYQCRDQTEMLEIHALISAAMMNKQQHLRGSDRVPTSPSLPIRNRRSSSPTASKVLSGYVRQVSVGSRSPRPHSNDRYRSERELSIPNKIVKEVVPVVESAKQPMMQSRNSGFYQSAVLRRRSPGSEQPVYTRSVSMPRPQSQMSAEPIFLVEKRPTTQRKDNVCDEKVPILHGEPHFVQAKRRQSRIDPMGLVRLVHAQPTVRNNPGSQWCLVSQPQPQTFQTVSKQYAQPQKAGTIIEGVLLSAPQRLQTSPYSLVKNSANLQSDEVINRLNERRPLYSIPSTAPLYPEVKTTQLRDLTPDNTQPVRLYRKSVIGSHYSQPQELYQKPRTEMPKPNVRNGWTAPQPVSTHVVKKLVTLEPVYISPPQPVKTVSVAPPIYTTENPMDQPLVQPVVLRSPSVTSRTPPPNRYSHHITSNWRTKSQPNVSVVYDDKPRQVIFNRSSAERLNLLDRQYESAYTTETSIPVGFVNKSPNTFVWEESALSQHRGTVRNRNSITPPSDDPILTAKKSHLIHLTPNVVGGPVISDDGPVYMYAERSRHQSGHQNSH
ncbi:hypothetical protein CSKR_103023 [Clonorchis sinensis]|uniref:Uncharacterized protein n=2 Tax=Clonorchis sinensis TaxID=79923 RepID=A0A8T1M5G0_CLOSI|nr:hypothetical protein CSKR_103023 [Clonorchis sinensis]GAA33075.1 hypothetical protein CLF_102207 [Clonorchis sinensis]